MLKTIRAYQASLIVSALLYVSYWFFPWIYFSFSPELQALLNQSGYRALIVWPEWVWWLFFLLTLSGYIGMFFFKRVLRQVFVLAIIGGILLAPTIGVLVLTGTEALLYDLSLFLKGFVLALSYSSELNKYFD